jgi:hypothetical protein
MTETANNTIVIPNFITDSVGGVWSISSPGSNGAQVCHNGVIDTSTANVTMLLYINSTVYHENTAGNFYRAPNWALVSDPRIIESPDGTIISGPGQTITDSIGEKWSLVASGNASVGNQIAVNGVIDSVTHLVVELVYKNHQIYQLASGGWWSKSKSTDSWKNASNPIPATPTPTTTSAPTPTTAPTPTIPTPTVPTISAPPPAASAGFNRLVFNDDFTSSSTIANNSSAQSGFNWYWVGVNSTSQYQVNTSMNAAAVNNGNNGGGSFASPFGGILTMNVCNNSFQDCFQTVPNNATSTSLGQSFQHAYFEAYMQFRYDGSATGGSWPGFWSWSVEGLVAGNTGQHIENPEVDFMEYSAPVGYGTTLHDWPANGGSAVTPPWANNAPIGNDGNLWPMDDNWHLYGCLWVSTGNGTGNVKFFRDNVQCKYSADPNGNGIATGVGSPLGQVILESRHMYLILGCGTGWTTNVDYVRVWQA